MERGTNDIEAAGSATDLSRGSTRSQGKPYDEEGKLNRRVTLRRDERRL